MDEVIDDFKQALGKETGKVAFATAVYGDTVCRYCDDSDERAYHIKLKDAFDFTHADNITRDEVVALVTNVENYKELTIVQMYMYFAVFNKQWYEEVDNLRLDSKASRSAYDHVVKAAALLKSGKAKIRNDIPQIAASNVLQIERLKKKLMDQDYAVRFPMFPGGS